MSTTQTTDQSKQSKWKWSNLLMNNYVVAFLVFIIWMLFFDKHRLAVQMNLSSVNQKLEDDKAYYEAEALKVEMELDEFSENMEKYAREKYFMKKQDEDVFIIEENN